MKSNYLNPEERKLIELYLQNAIDHNLVSELHDIFLNTSLNQEVHNLYYNEGFSIENLEDEIYLLDTYLKEDNVTIFESNESPDESYLEQIKEEPEIIDTEKTDQPGENSKPQLELGIYSSENDREALYEKSVSGGASGRWNASLEGTKNIRKMLDL